MCCKFFWKKLIPFVLTLVVSYSVVNSVKQWNLANENEVNVYQTIGFPEKVIDPNEESGSGCGECRLLESNEWTCFACRDGKLEPYIEFKSTKELSSKAENVQIIAKPKAKYTDLARQNQIQGTVRLRATLSLKGKVEDFLVISGLPYGLTEQAIGAAMQIKFKPAVKNGKPISKVVVLEYNFTIY